MLHCERHQLRGGMQAKFLADMPPVIANRIHTQMQDFSNLLARLAMPDLSQHFFFSARQRAVGAHQSKEFNSLLFTGAPGGRLQRFPC